MMFSRDHKKAGYRKEMGMNIDVPLITLNF